MNPTDEAVAKAEDELDKDIKAEDKEPKDGGASKTEEKDAKKTTDGDQKAPPTDEKEDKKTTEEEDDGYTADELEEADEGEEDKPADSRQDDGKSTKPDNLTPEGRFIYDNLPEIVTRDKSGKEVRLKTYTELPEGFEFYDKRTEVAFIANINAQELDARDLQRQFQEQQTQTSAKEFEQRENAGIKSDIADLQKSGDLPKFKLSPDDPKFATDPATEEAQKVLDYMNERNTQYAKEYEQGRPYRHIGFREAFYMYKRDNPGDIKSRAEHEEDKERKEIADKVAGNIGLSKSEMPKPVVKTGTTTRDILARIDSME